MKQNADTADPTCFEAVVQMQIRLFHSTLEDYSDCWGVIHIHHCRYSAVKNFYEIFARVLSKMSKAADGQVKDTKAYAMPKLHLCFHLKETTTGSRCSRVCRHYVWPGLSCLEIFGSTPCPHNHPVFLSRLHSWPNLHRHPNLISKFVCLLLKSSVKISICRKT